MINKLHPTTAANQVFTKRTKRSLSNMRVVTAREKPRPFEIRRPATGPKCSSRATKMLPSFVTGGNSGIGAAAALQFAREGAKIVIAAGRNDKSEAVVRQIETPAAKACFSRPT
jgi:hypothetical protein